MLLSFKAEAKSLRPRTNGPEVKNEAEARGYEAESKAKIGLGVSLASRL